MGRLATLTGILLLLLFTGVAPAKLFSYKGAALADPETRISFFVKAKNAKALEEGAVTILEFEFEGVGVLFNCNSGQVRREPAWGFDELEVRAGKSRVFGVAEAIRNTARWELEGRFRDDGSVKGFFTAHEDISGENCFAGASPGSRVRFEASRK